jgi:hypothetical protein
LSRDPLLVKMTVDKVTYTSDASAIGSDDPGLVCCHISTFHKAGGITYVRDVYDTGHQAFSYSDGHMRDCIHTHLYVEVSVHIAEVPSVRRKYHQPECSAECRMQSAKITECSLLRAPRRIHYSITTSSVCRCTTEFDPAIAACTPTLR